jgi:hypothetical protein
MAARTYTARECEKRETREARARGEFVGFLACSYGRGRLLKVALPDERASVSVPCPVSGCSETHRTRDSMPRPRQRGECCDVVIEPPPPPDPDNPTPPRTAPKSDAEVLAAIPKDWKLVTEIAEALGYTNRGSFVNRLREMRRRGVAIETRQEHRVAPMFVRRIEAA